MDIYKSFTANYPRNGSDKFFDSETKKSFKGCLAESLAFISGDQLENPNTWALFVEQFRCCPDDARAWWRGEFWGKMMRGACFVYSYSENERLYNILAATVEDILSTEDKYGRISTYSLEHEFDGWDIWGRKYVLLGMQYFLEISKDDTLNERIIASMRRQTDYLISKIGPSDEGKLNITKLTRHWRGLNSSSILEPVIRLYSITEDKKYLDFASYIVDCGFTDVKNIWKTAYENELHPYQYPVTKAYELTSCFIGLLEYYRVTKNEMYLKAVVNYADRVLEDDFTVIGSAGCTHELFDRSSVRQANPKHGDMRAQETCVTVTLMQLFYQLCLLTGDSKYIDAFEISLYNGYLGAVNTEKATDLHAAAVYPDLKLIPKTFDSYSPLTPGHRGNGIGGFAVLNGKNAVKDGEYNGCCNCIGAFGIGLAMKTAVQCTESGVVINLFEKGSVKRKFSDGRTAVIDIDTKYPVCGKVKLTVRNNTKVAFDIYVRNPSWSENTSAAINGEKQNVKEGYMMFRRVWNDGDIVEIEFDMTAKAVHPIPYGSQILMNEVVRGTNYIVPTFDREPPSAKYHVAVRRGPLMLARESRLGYNVDDAVDVKIEPDGSVNVKIPKVKRSPYRCLLEADIPTVDGGYFTTTDYASAGKLWSDESRMAVWMNTK